MPCPLVRRFNNGLMLYPGKNEPAVMSLSWDEADSLRLALQHELQERDIRDGVAPHSPPGSTCWCDRVHAAPDAPAVPTVGDAWGRLRA